MAAKKQELNLRMKGSTRELFFEQPTRVDDITNSENGRIQFVCGQLTLTTPEWFDRYSEDILVGDYIAGGWQAGKFSLDFFEVED